MSELEALRLSTSRPADADERVTLFFIDDHEYTIPKRPRANLALKYLDLVKKDGSDYAAAWLLEEMLGSEAYQALMDYDYLTPEQLDQVTALRQKHVLGKLEAKTGKR